MLFNGYPFEFLQGKTDDVSFSFHHPFILSFLIQSEKSNQIFIHSFRNNK